MISIYRNNEVLVNIEPADSSKVSQKLNGEDVAIISFKVPEEVDLLIGDYITVFDHRYNLNQLPNVDKISEREYQYDCVFESIQYDLRKVQYRDGITSDFSLTGDLSLFVAQIIANLNRVFTAWTLGDVPADTPDKTLQFTNENCLEVLQRLCTEYSVDFKIDENKTIHVGTFEQAAVHSFSYGQGNGLYKLTRKVVDSKDIITRLYPLGSEKNLPANYRNFSTRLKIEGDYVEQNTDKYDIIEWTEPFEDIYPRFQGAITGIDAADPTKFTCTAIDFDINAQLVPGTSAKVHFNSGALAGYEFEIVAYDHAIKTVTLKKLDQEKNISNAGTLESYQLPSDTLKPAVGDRIVFIDIVMPDSYITAAETELRTKALEYLTQNCEPRVAYALKIDPIYIYKNLIQLKKGDYLNVKDTALKIDKDVRITALVRYLNNEYNYEVDLSDSLSPQKMNRVVSDLEDIKRLVVKNRLNDIARANRNFKDSAELYSSVFDPDGFFDTERIKPLSIETSMLSVGSKSGNFQINCLIEPNLAGNSNYCRLGAGFLVHFSIEENPRTWTMAENNYYDLIPGTFYYIYAKCTRSAANTGTLVLDTAQRKTESDPTFYYFLVGLLHSDIDGVRGISRTYGDADINGKFIKGVLTSSDGQSYIDLNSGEIVGKLTFRSGKTDQEVEDIATGANSKIEGLQIGGRNLMPYSKGDVLKSFQATGVEFTDNYYAFYRSNASANENFINSPTIPATGGQFYTISFWYKGTANLRDIELFVLPTGWGTYGIQLYESFENTVNWKYFKGTFQLNINMHDIIVRFDNNGSTDGTEAKLYIRNVKVELGNKATDWTPAPEDVDAAIQENKGYVDTVKNDLQAQIDGQIISWFQENDPTVSNYPASEWSTDILKQQHANDTFTNTLTGGCWRWQQVGGVWQWGVITDTATQKALANAAKAQDTADGKRRVFSSQPVPPYDVDDLWTQGPTGDMLKCNVPKVTGQQFSLSDWGSASKYTDDTAANAAQQRAIEAERTAKAYAEAQANIAAETAQAYADGIVTYEEQRAINDATNKANAAKDAAIFAAAADASEKVNSIQVGGRNLFIDGSFERGFLGINGGTIPINIITGPFDASLYPVYGNKCLFFSGDQNNSGGDLYFYLANNVKIIRGETYTISFYYMSAGGVTNNSSYINLNNQGHMYIPVSWVPDKQWRRFVYTFKNTADDYFYLRIGMLVNSFAWGAIDAIQVERGTRATDWTPAPEDVDAGISEAMAKAMEADYLKTAMQGATEVLGGLVLANLLMTKNAAGEVTSGMSGDSNDNVGVWTGGTYAQAIQGLAKNILYKNGAFRLAGGDVTYDIETLALTISALIRTAVTGERVEISKEDNSITIYDANNAPKMKFAPKNVLPFSQISSNTVTETITYPSHSNEIGEEGTADIGSTETLVLDSAKFYDITTPNVMYDIRATGYYDAGTKTHAFCSAGVTVQLVDTVRNVVVWQRNKVVSSSSATSDTDAGTIAATVLKAQKGSTYRIDVLLMVDQDETFPTLGIAWASIAAGQTLSGVTLASFSEIGLNGVNFINDATHYLHYGEDGLAYKGVSDMPGLLATGSVSNVAGHSNKWGAKVATDAQPIIKGGTGIYNVPHNLNSSEFTVIPVATTDNINCRVTGKTNTTFQITCRNMSGIATDASFDYTMLGNN